MQNLNQDQENSEDHWPLPPFDSFENECIEQFQTGPNFEERLALEKSSAEQCLYYHFQNSANAISHLYKDQGSMVWRPFQAAALALTNLYQEGLTRVQTGVELGLQTGHNSRTKEILNWVKKKRKNIQREDLLAFLCGKQLPVRGRVISTGKPRSLFSRHRHSDSMDGDGLHGAVSGLTFHDNSSTPLDDIRLRWRDDHVRSDSRKRITAPPDCIMDSPFRKRPRPL